MSLSNKSCACRLSFFNMCPSDVFSEPGALHRRKIATLFFIEIDIDLSSYRIGILLCDLQNTLM